MKKLKNYIAIITILILSITMIACSKEEDKSKTEDASNVTYPLIVKDSLDREITIDKEPEKIISLSPSITETVCALGKEDKLIGRTEFCNYPESVKRVEAVGGLQDPNIERIVELKPDIVIASAHFKEDVLKKLESLNVKVVVLYGPEDFEGAYKTIENISKALNTKAKGNEIIEGMKKKVDDVKKKVEGRDKVKAYYVVGYGQGGDFTAGGDTFIGKMIEMAGGENAAKDLKGWKFSLEKVVESNPDLFIVRKGGNDKKELKQVNGYKELKAIKEDKIYEIEDNIINLQGPRLADGLEELAKIMHPDVFK